MSGELFEATIDQERHAIDLEKVRAETTSRVTQRDAEIQRLRAQIDAMQETLAKREDGTEKPNAAPRDESTAPDPATRDLSETRELRDHLRRLKRPGTLRVRIAGDYRLLFETGPADSLRLVDFILRRDLDRWLAGGGR
jgi:hypothetical protein